MVNGFVKLHAGISTAVLVGFLDVRVVEARAGIEPACKDLQSSG